MPSPHFFYNFAGSCRADMGPCRETAVEDYDQRPENWTYCDAFGKRDVGRDGADF